MSGALRGGSGGGSAPSRGGGGGGGRRLLSAEGGGGGTGRVDPGDELVPCVGTTVWSRSGGAGWLGSGGASEAKNWLSGRGGGNWLSGREGVMGGSWGAGGVGMLERLGTGGMGNDAIMYCVSRLLGGTRSRSLKACSACAGAVWSYSFVADSSSLRGGGGGGGRFGLGGGARSLPLDGREGHSSFDGGCGAGAGWRARSACSAAASASSFAVFGSSPSCRARARARSWLVSWPERSWILRSISRCCTSSASSARRADALAAPWADDSAPSSSRARRADEDAIRPLSSGVGGRSPFAGRFPLFASGSRSRTASIVAVAVEGVARGVARLPWLC